MSLLIRYASEENRGYVSDLDSLYGQETGYYYVVAPAEKANRYVLHMNVTFDESNDVSEKLELLRQADASIAHAGYSNSGINLEVDLSENSDLNGVIERAVNIAAEEKLEQFCSMSGRTDDLGVYRFDNRVDIYNAQEYETIAAKYQKEFSSENTNIFYGFLGALIGGMIGVLIWVLLSYINIVAAFAGYAIIVFALSGFKKLGGRPKKVHIVGIVVLSIGLVFLAEYLSYVVLVMQTGNLTLIDAFSLTAPILMRDPELIGNFLLNLLLGYVFFAVGGFRTIVTAFKETQYQFIAQRLL